MGEGKKNNLSCSVVYACFLILSFGFSVMAFCFSIPAVLFQHHLSHFDFTLRYIGHLPFVFLRRPEFGLSNSPFSFDDFNIERGLFGQETVCCHGCHEIRGKSSDAPVARVFNLNDVLQFVVHRLDQRPFPP